MLHFKVPEILALNFSRATFIFFPVKSFSVHLYIFGNLEKINFPKEHIIILFPKIIKLPLTKVLDRNSFRNNSKKVFNPLFVENRLKINPIVNPWFQFEYFESNFQSEWIQVLIDLILFGCNIVSDWVRLIQTNFQASFNKGD